MARASTATLLSLDRFAQIAGIHPMHFNQVYVDNLAPTVQCDMTLLQYSWQMNDGISREEIALAIAEAEADIENFLGYPVAPRYYDEILRPQRPYRADMYLDGALLDLSRKYVLSGGIRSASLLADSASIAYSDVDDDTYSETAIVSGITVPAGTLTGEVKIYYPGHNAEPEWEIRPTRVTISSNVAEISFKREQCVTEVALEAYGSSPVNGLEDDNFLSAVDVYRVTTDLSAQAVMFYMSSPCDCNTGDSCALCEHNAYDGCIEVVSQRQGQVRANLATWNGTSWGANTTCCVGYPLSKVRARYLAGANLDANNMMQSKYELCVARLAMTKLDRPMCTCESVQANFGYWQTDLALNIAEAGSSTSRNVPSSVLTCPFGTMRAAIWVYNLLKDRDRVAS